MVAAEFWETLQAAYIRFAQIDPWSHGAQRQAVFLNPLAFNPRDTMV